MNTKQKIALYSGFLIAAVLSCVLLQRWQEFAFFYLEQNQIFLFDWDDIFSKIMTPGGFALVLSQFIAQFFKVRLVGTVVTALLGACAAWLLWRAVGKARAPVAAFPLCFLPVFLQEGALGDMMYLYQGFVAFLIAALGFWVYAEFFSEKGTATRTVAGTILTIFLYCLAGPVALLVGLSIAVYDLCAGRKAWYFSFIPAFAALLCGWLAIRLGAVQDFRLALLQDGYYEPLLKAGWYIHASWVALPLVVAAAVLIKGLKGNTLKAMAFGAAAVLSLAVLLRIPAHKDSKYYDMLRLNRYITVQDWDAILKDKTARQDNYLMMNIRNLALSHKGELLDKLFAYPQKGFMSLLAEDEQSRQNTDLTVLDSHISYQMGSVANSQNMAFDSSVGLRFGNPSMTMRLIRTNLVWGAWGVAEKYISKMEKTWGYRKEASSLRHFLRNDKAVLEDPELGRLRRDLPAADHFVGMDTHEDLRYILRANPEDKAAREYYLAYMLLAKDLEGLKEYIENDPGAYSADGTLHPHLQEAVLVYSEEDEAYCCSHGVTEATFERYNAFRRKFLELGANGGNPVSGMRSFSDSFWYYFMFTKIQ